MLKVMVVDDDRKVCKCLEKMIRWDTVHCTPPVTAHDGREALRLIQEDPPDILISDVRMPVMDGVDLCREIREYDRNMKIIFLSAYEDFATAQTAIKYGVQDYILKPLNRNRLDELEAILARIAAYDQERQIYTNLIIDVGQREELLTHLWQKDTEYVERLLKRIHNLQLLDALQMQNVYLWLLNILYQYYEHAADIGYDQIRRLYARDMSALRECETSPEQFAYIEHIYHRMMEKINKIKEETSITRRIRSYMKENFANPEFNVSSVAEYFHFSLTHIGRIFAEQEEITLSDYLFQLRIEEAKRLLRSTELPINDVAGRAGYSNANYFAKVFRKAMNLSPSEYRDTYHI